MSPSAAVIVTLEEPKAVGVPLITPVEALRLNPDGNPEDDQEYE
jgi:hypothetical protein